MLNVCFGDSECGMLKLALGGEGATFSHRHLEYGSIDADSFEEGVSRYFFGGIPNFALNAL